MKVAGPYLPVQVFATPGAVMDAGTQTEHKDEFVDQGAVDTSDSGRLTPPMQQTAIEDPLERMIQHLSSKDLASLINSLQAITTDVNLSSSLGNYHSKPHLTSY